ncbi:hypothetical protein CK203_109666 [Vitis vinifera]|uniref:Uncharacterized protein n=1 Tax=Vitis vinifera TaxID=29760 RepID=A0A438CF64_VITVI|nr:hypothetical protein CK203_109666 [Vitis vinifera]
MHAIISYLCTNLSLDSARWLVAQGLAAGYIDAREHYGGERHFDVDWSPIIEDLYSPELGNPLGCRGSACVEVMTTLHGSTPSLFEACRWLRTVGGTPSLHVGASVGLQSRFSSNRSTDTFSLGSTSWIRVGGRLIRVSDQLDQRSDQRDMDSQIVTLNQFAEAMASIQEAIASLGQRIDGQQAQQVPPPIGAQYDPTVPPPPPPNQSAPQAMPFTLYSQTGLRASDRATTWEGFDGVPVASLPAKFKMPDIEREGPDSDGFEEPAAADRQTCGRGPVHRFWVSGYGSVRCRGRHLERIIDRFFPSDIKGKKPFVGSRPADVSVIGSSSQRPLRRNQPIPQFPEPHSSYASHQYRPRAPRPAYDQTYTSQTLALPYYASQGIERPSVSYTATGQPCYAAQFTARPATSYSRPRAQQTSAPFALRAQRQFSRIGMPLSQALRNLQRLGY